MRTLAVLVEVADNDHSAEFRLAQAVKSCRLHTFGIGQVTPPCSVDGLIAATDEYPKAWVTVEVNGVYRY